MFTIEHRDEIQLLGASSHDRQKPPTASAVCLQSLFNCAQFLASTRDRLILMAVIWIDEFEGGTLDSLIGITLYEQQKVQPLERAITPQVYRGLWQELVLLLERLCRSQ
jgi:hypothetical protein